MTKKYLCDDGNAELEIEAESAEEAAKEYVGNDVTVDVTEWVRVTVTEILPDCEHPHLDADGACGECGAECEQDGGVCMDAECSLHGDDGKRRLGESQSISIELSPEEPEEPECDSPGHDWRSPYSVLGGCKENPGVWGKGGGVIIREVCARCGWYRETDTWAQDFSTGEQGLRSVTYADPDDTSRAWVTSERRE